MSRDYLRSKLEESEAENDQWQRKLADTWVELAALRRELHVFHAILNDRSLSYKQIVERLRVADEAELITHLKTMAIGEAIEVPLQGLTPRQVKLRVNRAAREAGRSIEYGLVRDDGSVLVRIRS